MIRIPPPPSPPVLGADVALRVLFAKGAWEIVETPSMYSHMICDVN